MGSMALRARITVKGIVQGVGFRPYVYTLASDLDLKGYVTNTADGVLIDIEGARLSDFLQRLPKEAPPLSQITDISVTTLPFHGYREFTIQKSVDHDGGRPFTLISPDISVCDDCLNELFNPSDRRYLYPFINCTQCGPRYTITKSVPYDRPNTTMSAFTMCPECSREYNDPKNRRFHAQPNACSTCGPQVEFKIQNSKYKIADREAVIACIQLIQDGGIVAVKGLGGFHIACDAMNDEAVKKMRERKRKSNKPFAVMAPDVETVKQFCIVSEEEKNLLESAKRPIALLRKKPDTNGELSQAVSPNNQYIGVMLPYTPLHYLLFYDPVLKRFLPHSALCTPHFAFHALVMTSGNLAEEPIVRDNEEAFKNLSGIVDAFLVHNRDIFMRVDDSVVRVASAECGMRSAECRTKHEERLAGLKHSELDTSDNVIRGQAPNSVLMFLRRSRGYSPEPIPLHDDGPEVLGCGADLKNTFTLTKGAYAIPSQHIGDMENYETLRFFDESLENLKTVYRVNPVAIVHDLHPGYLSTRWALDQVRSAECGVRNSVNIYSVQHHYAHIGSVMAEHGLKGPVIGVAFDGTGYGADGNLWGGEFLIADIDGFERVGQFRYVPLPGGEAAIREPWRTAVSYVCDAAGQKAWDRLDRLGFPSRYGRSNVEQVMKIIPSREFSPLSSGCGRLFDAVSAVVGACDRNTFEGEAAMALESLTQGEGCEEEYPVEFRRENGYTVVDFSPMILNILDDVVAGREVRLIATRFHNTVASVIRTVVSAISHTTGFRDAALSGGTFQNLYLLSRAAALLKAEGLNVYINHQVPANDAGISLGQAYLARERMKIANSKMQKSK